MAISLIGPEGLVDPARLHDQLAEMNKSIPDDLSGSLESLTAQVTALEARNTALQEQLDGLSVGTNVLLYNEIQSTGPSSPFFYAVQHNLNTFNVQVHVYLQGGDLARTWNIGEQPGSGFNRDENLFYIKFSAALTNPFDLYVWGIKES